MRSRKYQPHIYLNETEYNQLEKLSQKTGMTINTVIRKLIMGAELSERPNRDYRTLARAVDRIGVNINQIAHMANITRRVGNEEIQRLLEEFRSLQKEIEAWKKQWL